MHHPKLPHPPAARVSAESIGGGGFFMPDAAFFVASVGVVIVNVGASIVRDWFRRNL